MKVPFTSLDGISNYLLWVELRFKWKRFGALGMLHEVNVLKFLETVLSMKLEISRGITEHHPGGLSDNKKKQPHKLRKDILSNDVNRCIFRDIFLLISLQALNDRLWHFHRLRCAFIFSKKNYFLTVKLIIFKIAVNFNSNDNTQRDIQEGMYIAVLET